jgi:thiol-disulfide isomerase/thioredoxin
MRLAALAIAFFLSTSVLEGALKHGDTAPPLDIAKWLRGDAVDLQKAREKKVVVVEFWATWCPPCRTSIPHLTELQKKHKKDVVIIGVTRPDPRNSLETVEGFVKEWGEKMDYTVAFDEMGKTYDAYMTATNQSGIPTAFIIDKSGKLAWLGHPMAMDEPLAQVLAGTFDIKKAGREHELRNQMQELQQGFFMKLQKADLEGARKDGEKIIELSKDDAETLNNISWLLLTHPAAKGKSQKLALSAATRCDEITKGENWMYLDTLALATFESGKPAEAVKLQKKALELAGKAKAPDSAVTELKERLESFEKDPAKQ